MARLCRRVILITRLNQFVIFLGGKAIKDYNFISFFFLFWKSNVARPRNEREYINCRSYLILEFRNICKKNLLLNYFLLLLFYFPCYVKEKINQI